MLKRKSKKYTRPLPETVGHVSESLEFLVI